MSPLPDPAGFLSSSELDYAHALLNILEDSASEKAQLQDAQKAVLNILDDFSSETEPFRDSQRAVLNILEDFSEEKTHLEDMKTAVLNILEDLAWEKQKLEATQKEVLKSEEAIRASLGEKEMLLKEIHHRVKNNLQVIASLLRLQSRHLKDEQARAMFKESQNRVYSISLVHEKLYRANDLARVDFNDYLHDLTSGLANGWKGTCVPVDIQVQAEGIQLGVDTAIPCGLIVTELVTNALKHAFAARASGWIHVGAARDADGLLVLAIQDNGIGLPEHVNFGRSRTLGLELVNSLAMQLGAKIEISRGTGTTFRIRFALSNDYEGCN